MTAPAPARYCEHCKGQMVGKQLLTKVLGALPITLSLCKCDYLTCHHCKVTVYDRHARRCTCGRDPGVATS